MQRVLLRVDRSNEIGWGHWIRCLALSQSLQRHAVEHRWLTCEGSGTPIPGAQVLSSGTPAGSSDDARQTIDLAKSFAADWIVLDGYHFSTDFRQQLRFSGLQVLYADDLGMDVDPQADALWNPNLHATPNMYPQAQHATTLMLGGRFTCLRQEFLDLRNVRRRHTGTARRLIVLLGGHAPVEQWHQVLQAVATLDSVQVTGMPAGQRDRELESCAQKLGIHWETNSNQIVQAMQQADWAISAAGSTCWELAFLGIPSVILVRAENQLPAAEFLHRQGCAIYVPADAGGEWTGLQGPLRELQRSPQRLLEMQQRSLGLVDGYGAERICDLLWGEKIQFRPATQEDRLLFKKWGEDAEVPGSLVFAQPALWYRHEDLFTEKLKAAKSRLWVALNEAAQPIGYVHFEVQGETAEIQFGPVPDSREGDTAASMMVSAIRELSWKEGIHTVSAVINPQHHGSIRVFELAGFEGPTEPLTRNSFNAHDAVSMNWYQNKNNTRCTDRTQRKREDHD